MGRITVFTTDDILSRRVLGALEERNLPYVEISLLEHPRRRADVELLTSRSSVPQVFFNTRYVGGVTATLKELSRWDRPTAAFSTPLERFMFDIQNQPEPGNTKLAVPSPPSVDSMTSASKGSERYFPLEISLPDGTKTSTRDMMEKLRSAVVREKLTHRGVTFFKSFIGTELYQVIRESLSITDDETQNFCEHLLEANVVVPVKEEKTKDFKAESCIYRLHCDSSPQILNSYRKWPNMSQRSCNEVVEDLDSMLREIELSNLNDEFGWKVDHVKVRVDSRFAIFEEAVCELQGVCLEGLGHHEMTAIALNLYHVMMRYAFVKVGVCLDESARLAFASNLKFYVGEHLFSFQEWVDGILRCNKRARFSRKVPFDSRDPRRAFSLSRFDRRVLFALNIGPWMGSRVSLPFNRYSAEDIDEQLDLASQIFCEDDVNVFVNRKQVMVEISKPLMWYRHDFARKDRDMIAIIAGYLQGVKKFDMKKALSQSREVKLSFLDVDYARNACNFIEFDEKHLQSKLSGVMTAFLRFRSPKKSQDELARLATLHSLNLLDTLPEERFDRITKMVQVAFEIPIVFVTLVDEDRQWFKSSQWACPVPAPQETGRDISFCGHTILGAADEILEIPDTTQDDRFADNPFVREGLKIRYYVGYNLSIPATGNDTGLVNIGTLCMLDFKPRELDQSQRKQLIDYAQLVKGEVLLNNKSSIYRPSIAAGAMPPPEVEATKV